MDQFQKQVSGIQKEKERLSQILKEISVVEKVYPSDANFLLVKVNDANYIYNALISKNIITRNRSSLVDNCLRITIGKKSENDKLINALHELENII
jgi:histidinol-phosphate aminotransferase